MLHVLFIFHHYTTTDYFENFYKLNQSLLYITILYAFNLNYLAIYLKKVILTWCREKPQESSGRPYIQT